MEYLDGGLAIKKILDDIDFAYDEEIDSEKKAYIITSGCCVENILEFVDLRIIVRDDMISGVASMMMNVPEEYRAQMAEYITRMNYGILGAVRLEMDFNDGEVRAYYNVRRDDEGIPPEEGLKSVLDMPCDVMNDYGDQIYAVATGASTALAAYIRSENMLQADDGVSIIYINKE